MREAELDSEVQRVPISEHDFHDVLIAGAGAQRQYEAASDVADLDFDAEVDGLSLIQAISHDNGERLVRSSRGGWHIGAKRALDVIVSATALLVLAPVLLVAMILVKLDSPGPALFRQRRVGLDGTSSMIFKLRTMVVDAERLRAELLHRNEADGPLFKLSDDPRVTRLGRILRKLSIDELPQFANVLLGHMSLVGPRPALPEELVAWPPELHGRLRVRPGITGLWQISGRSSCSFDDYARLDLYYVDNWSLATDLAILVRTVPLVLRGHGAH